MSQRYAMIVFTGSPSPQVVRSVGPFPSADAASAWCEQERLGQTPVCGRVGVGCPAGSSRELEQE